jgi:hypothetical protein
MATLGGLMREYGRGVKRVLICGSIILAVCSASLIWHETAMGGDRQMPEEPAYEAAFFDSPRQAVDAIRKMLMEEDWASLAGYYDLDGSDVDRKTLISGEFFVRTERPRVSHPAGFWRYKHPFAPGFEYSFDSLTDQAGIVAVRVSISIDQGSGSPTQQGWHEFQMRRSERGFQILPEARAQVPAPDLAPVSAPAVPLNPEELEALLKESGK